MSAVLIYGWVEFLLADPTTSMCIWTTAEPKVMLLQRKTGLNYPPPPLILFTESFAFQNWFAVECSSCLIYMSAVLIYGWVEFFLADPTTSMCIWNTAEPKVMLLQRKTGLNYPPPPPPPPPSNLLLSVPRRCFCCGLFLLSMSVRFLFQFI